jgi:hypothetical protein
MQDALAALPADPRASIRFGLSIHQHRDGPIHPDPAVAVTMLQSWVALAQHPELSRVDHPDLRTAGLLPDDTERMCETRRSDPL